MNFTKLQRLGGISIILGAFLLVLWTVCWTFLLPISKRMSDYSLMILNTNWTWISVISLLGIIFMIFGFISVYSGIHDRTGVSGLIGFIFVILAYVFQAAKVTWELYIYPLLVSNQNSIFMIKDRVFFASPEYSNFKLLANLTIFAGMILFCISIFRSKKFDILTPVLIFIGALLYGAGPLINAYIAIAGVVIFSVGCLLLGLKMIREKE